MKPEIRLARHADADDLVALLREMHAESGFGTFSEAKARVAIEIGLRRELAMIGVIRGRREIEGSIGLFLSQPPFSSDAVLTDQWCIVREAYRKSTRAKDLINFAKWAATELNKPLMVTAVSNEQTARRVEVLERQLPKAGSMFLFTPPQAA